MMLSNSERFGREEEPKLTQQELERRLKQLQEQKQDSEPALALDLVLIRKDKPDRRYNRFPE
jgi:hypothetical protein